VRLSDNEEELERRVSLMQVEEGGAGGDILELSVIAVHGTARRCSQQRRVHVPATSLMRVSGVDRECVVVKLMLRVDLLAGGRHGRYSKIGILTGGR
jgi:hypothetical protein